MPSIAIRAWTSTSTLAAPLPGLARDAFGLPSSGLVFTHGSPMHRSSSGGCRPRLRRIRVQYGADRAPTAACEPVGGALQTELRCVRVLSVARRRLRGRPGAALRGRVPARSRRPSHRTSAEGARVVAAHSTVATASLGAQPTQQLPPLRRDVMSSPADRSRVRSGTSPRGSALLGDRR
jgi:hypothetical protein